MPLTKTPLERAFELARSGMVRDVSEIKTRLATEGFDYRQVAGPTLLKQLRRVIKQNAPPTVD